MNHTSCTYRIEGLFFIEVYPQGDSFILGIFFREVTVLFQWCVKICNSFETKCIDGEVVHLITGANNIKNDFISEIVWFQMSTKISWIHIKFTYLLKDGGESVVWDPGMLENWCLRSPNRPLSALSAESLPGTFLRIGIIGTCNHDTTSECHVRCEGDMEHTPTFLHIALPIGYITKFASILNISLLRCCLRAVSLSLTLRACRAWGPLGSFWLRRCWDAWHLKCWALSWIWPMRLLSVCPDSTEETSALFYKFTAKGT